VGDITRLARGTDPVPLTADAMPFVLVPRLDLWPSDFPWLAAGVIAPERAQAFRHLFTTACLDAARSTIDGGRPVPALMMLAGAMNFSDPDPLRLATVHFETSRALFMLLEGRSAMDGAIGGNAVHTLAMTAAHLQVARQHLAGAGAAVLDSSEAASLIAEVDGLERQVLRYGYFRIEGDLIIGPPPLGVARIRELLFPSVPVGPDR